LGPGSPQFTGHTVHDLKLSHFFPTKTAEKCDNLGTFTQKIPFLDYNKPKKAKSVTIWSVTIWGHGLYIPGCFEAWGCKNGPYKIIGKNNF